MSGKRKGTEKESLVNHFSYKNEDRHPVFKQKLTLGKRAADALARYAGSWVFIIGFLLFLVVWIAINFYGWMKSWDPYPFILLNLVLSCLAAIQAPIILMSQNRQAERDRIDASYDHAVNRKAERENRVMMRDLEKIRRILGEFKKGVRK